MAAPQLLAGVEGAELGSTEELGWDGSREVPPRPHSGWMGVSEGGGQYRHATCIGSVLTAVHVL